MAAKSTATTIGSTTWTVFNTLMTKQQRVQYLYSYLRLGGTLDETTLPISAGLVKENNKYKTTKDTNRK